MAEVYWMNGFEIPLVKTDDLTKTVQDWLAGVYVRPNWVEQIEIITDGNPQTLLAELQNSTLPLGFVYATDNMDEHFFLQQILRRMRMDETECQLILNLSEEKLYGALIMSHRQVGRSNLLPKLILAEQMVVLQPQILLTRMVDFPHQSEEGIYLCSPKDAHLTELSENEIEGVQFVSLNQPNLLGCLMEINASETLKNKPGFLLTCETNQPALITSVQGC
ncbi:MAG: hypothetical protein JEZ00_01215 [Anaerolineaceae bacterium]|nr:hypothetical protein [Anaerolineaceae bacterium]